METNYEPIYIRIHYWKFIKSSLVAWGFLLGLLFVMQHGDFFMSGRFKYIGLLALYILAPMAIIIVIPPALWSLWRIFYIKKPLLIITKEGFTDCSSYASCGFIAWKDVKNINRQPPFPPIGPLDNKYEESINIMVAVKNLKNTLQTIPFIRRKIIEIYMRFLLMNDCRFLIALEIAQSSSDVLKTMQAYKVEYDRIHKAKKINNDV